MPAGTQSGLACAEVEYERAHRVLLDAAGSEAEDQFQGDAASNCLECRSKTTSSSGYPSIGLPSHSNTYGHRADHRRHKRMETLTDRFDRLRIDREKLTQYLLNVNHQEGRGKAIFFYSVGFDGENWSELAIALRNHADEGTVVASDESTYGTKYVVDGPLRTPGGKKSMIRSVWLVTDEDDEESSPRLITAYPP